MQRAPGWIRLAGIALELSALAFIAYVVMGEQEEGVRQAPRYLGDASTTSETPCEAAVAEAPREEQPSSEPVLSQPIDFITESADGKARYYRAGDNEVEMLAGFYSDGRVRLASEHRRFAGMLQSGRADLLELDTNQWSEVLVHETPSGTIELELRGGPYDAHVLTCEPFDK